MFKSLKLYKNQSIDLERTLAELVDFGYKRQEIVQEEGDFARRGLLLDIFPFSFELPVRIELDNNQIQSIKSINPETSEALWEHRIIIVLPVKKPSSIKAFNFSEDFPLNTFVDIKSGDYVVHNEYGIGRFLGMEKIKLGDQPRDHLVIEYDRQEKLYVPVESMHLVQKYIAFHVRRPKLYRLGSKEWQRIKLRARRGIQKLAWELLTLQAMRLSSGGFKFSKKTEWQAEFEKTFPFKETPDQIKATEEVRRDMEEPRPMDRLLCGDVGYGKTEVAMRAAFKAMMDNCLLYTSPSPRDS